MSLSSNTRNIQNNLTNTYIPKRTEDELIRPEEYKKTTLGKSIPNLLVAVTYFDKENNTPLTREVLLHDLLGNGKFALCNQPGASTDEEAICKLYSTKKGAPGCSGELYALDEISPEMQQLGYKTLFVCSTKPSEQQRQIFEDRNRELKNKNIQFISDSSGALAKALRLFLIEDTITNEVTRNPHTFKFIERVQLFGEKLVITDFICAAQMKNSTAATAGKNNALALPAYIRQKQEAEKTQQQQSSQTLSIQADTPIQTEEYKQTNMSQSYK